MNVAANTKLPISPYIQANPTLSALTSLRFIAAAMIVALHAQGHFGIPAGIASTYSLGAGVTIFFVLSGFILTYVYPNLRASGATRRFLVARVARIWPLHVASSLFVMWLFGWFQLDQQNAAWRIVINLTMTQAWIPLAQIGSINGPAWTISTEFGFYLLFPFLIADFAKTWWWKLLISAGLAGVMVGITAAFSMPFGGNEGVNGAALVYMHPFGRLLEFVIGMCTALAWRSFKPARSMNVWYGTAIEISAVGALFLSIQHLTLGDINNPLIRWYHTSLEPAMPAAALIFVLASRYGWISRALEFKWIETLGEASYAIYLLHMPLLLYYWGVIAPSQVPQWAQLSIYLCVLLTVSFVFWQGIEKPARRTLVRTFGCGTQYN
jgi:peptidoglycan/LPS O-acetylase OafA/YrhL